MQIDYTTEFRIELRKIQRHILKDNATASKKFAKDLKKQIEDIPIMPYKYRKSRYHNDEQVRDMVFRGYTIIYKIYEDFIQIVEIFNQNLPVSKKGNIYE